jgi:hypothetical protein
MGLRGVVVVVCEAAVGGVVLEVVVGMKVVAGVVVGAERAVTRVNSCTRLVVAVGTRITSLMASLRVRPAVQQQPLRLELVAVVVVVVVEWVAMRGWRQRLRVMGL